MVFDVFRCAVCGSIGLNSGTCGVCGGVVRDIREDTSGSLTASGSIGRRRVAGQRVRPFWTGTKIVASIVVVVVAVSSVGAGLYISARPSGPSCRNLALNYPSCNSCYSNETYNCERTLVSAQAELSIRPHATGFVPITRLILQIATAALIIIQM